MTAAAQGPMAHVSNATNAMQRPSAPRTRAQPYLRDRSSDPTTTTDAVRTKK